MAEMFKSSEDAGLEVRRLGQSPTFKDNSMDYLMSEGRRMADSSFEKFKDVVPPIRNGIARQPSTDVRRKLDAEMDLSWIPQQATPANNVESSDGTALGDVGRSLARGGLSLFGGGYELANLATLGGLDKLTESITGTAGTKAYQDARDALNKQDSPELQRQRALMSKADGFWDSLATVLTNPRLAGSMAVEMVPQLVGVMGAAKKVATTVLTRSISASEAAVAAGTISKEAAVEAAQKAATRAATYTVMGLNPALEAGMSASDTRHAIMTMEQAELEKSPQYQELVKQYGDTPDGLNMARQRLANDAATIAAAVTLPISLASNALTAGFEAKLVTGGLRKVENYGLKGLAREVGEGVIKEPIQESIEEGGSQFGQNVGTRLSGAKPNQDIWEGVPQSAGAGAAMGVMAGAGFGAGNARFGLRKPSDGAAAPVADAPPAAGGENTGGSGGGTATRPTSVAIDDNQYTAIMQSEHAEPLLAALYATNKDDMTRSQLVEAARRNGLNIDLATASEDSGMLERGVSLINNSGGALTSAFMGAVSRNVSQPNTVPLPPKLDERTPYQDERYFEEHGAREKISAAEMLADSLEKQGIKVDEKLKSGLSKAVADGEIAAPGEQQSGQQQYQNSQMQRFAGIADALSRIPDSPYRSGHAETSMNNMVAAGFSPEQAQGVFGHLIQPRQTQVEPLVSQQAAEPTPDIPTEATQQVTQPTQEIAPTNVGDAGGAPIVSEAPPPLTTAAAPARPNIVSQNASTQSANPPVNIEAPADGAGAHKKQIGSMTDDDWAMLIGAIQGAANENADHDKIGSDDAKLLRKMVVKIIKDGIEKGSPRERIVAQIDALTKGGISTMGMHKINEFIEHNAKQYGAAQEGNAAHPSDPVERLLAAHKAYNDFVLNWKEDDSDPINGQQIYDETRAALEMAEQNAFEALHGKTEAAINEARSLNPEYASNLDEILEEIGEFDDQGTNTKDLIKLFNDVSGFINDFRSKQPSLLDQSPSTPTSSAPTQESKAAPTGISNAEFKLPKAVDIGNKKYIVKNGSTKKTRGKKPVVGNTNYESQVITVDEKNAIKQFPEKPWSVPKVEGVVALPEDAFATPNEWVRFVYEHEVSHANNPKPLDGQSKAHYENQMNYIALTKVKGEAYADSVISKEQMGLIKEIEPKVVEAPAQEWQPTQVEPTTKEPVAKEVAPPADNTGDDIGIPNRPATPGVDQEYGRASNPNVKSGEYTPSKVSETPDSIKALEENRRLAKEAAERNGPKDEKPFKRPLPPKKQLPAGEVGIDYGDISRKEVNKFKGEANRIMGVLTAGADRGVADALEKRIARIQRLGEKTGWANKAEVEYVLKNLDPAADEGKLYQGDARLDRKSKERIPHEQAREMISRLSGAITAIRKSDATKRAEALRESAQKVKDELAALRQRMVEAGVSESGIDHILSAREEGIENVISGKVDADTVANEEADYELTQEDIEAAERDPAAASDIVDAMMTAGEIDGTRSLLALRSEKNAANISNADLFNEMRLRGFTPTSEMIALYSQPGVRYTLDYWMKKNEGSNPYIIRTAWLSSLSNALDRMDASLRKEYLAELRPEEKSLLNKWNQAKAEMASRTEERVVLIGNSEAHPFGSVENAFPHALFNKYPLSFMEDPGKMPEDVKAEMLALAGWDPSKLVGMWMSDVDAVIQARKDLEPQVRETLSDSEWSRFTDWREQRIKADQKKAKMVADSPAYSQLHSLKELLTKEEYNQLKDRLAAVEQAQYPVIIQTAYELAEARRVAEQAKVDPDGVAEAIIDHLTTSTETEAQAATRIYADENGDTTGDAPWEVEQEAPNSDPAQILEDDMRLRVGRQSAVLTNAHVQNHIIKTTSGWTNAPNIVVLPHHMHIQDEALRDSVSRKVAERGAEGAKGLMAPDGTVYIFSDFHGSLEDVDMTLVHEVYRHYGTRAFLGNNLDSFLNIQYKTNQQVKAEADKLISDARERGIGITVLEATDEAIADLALKNKDGGAFTKIIVALKKFFKSIGMTNISQWLEQKSYKDLAYVLSQARKAVREGSPSTFGPHPSDIRLSAASNPVDLFATRGNKTTAYGMYNAATANWTVFYNPEGLSENTFGIETFDNYKDALARAREFGKVVSAKDHPFRRQLMPGDFNQYQIVDPSNVTGMKSLARRAYMALVNKYAPVVNVVKQYIAQGGDGSLLNSLTLMNGRIKPYIDDLRRNYMRPMSRHLTAIEQSGDSYTFKDVVYKGWDLADLYVMAKHAPERNAVIARISSTDGGKAVENGSGMYDSEARKILSDLSQMQSAQDFEAISKMLAKLSKKKVSMMLETQLIGESTAAALSSYDWYVNLSGNNDKSNEYVGRGKGGMTINMRGNDAVRATGRTSVAVDVIENTIDGYVQSVIRSQKNVVAVSLAQMVSQINNPEFAVINPYITMRKLDVNKIISDKGLYSAIGDESSPESGKDFVRKLQAKIESGEMSSAEAAGEIYKRLQEAYAQRRINGNQFNAYALKVENADMAAHNVLSKEGYVSNIVDTDAMNRDDVMVAKVGGKPVYMKFMEGADDHRAGKYGTFISAIHGPVVNDTSWLSEGMGWLIRGLGQLITSRNLTWVPVNWMRDTGTVYMNAAADPKVGAKLARQMFRKAPESYSVAMRMLMESEYMDANGPVYKFVKRLFNKPLTAEQRAMWKEFESSGAQVFFMDRKGMDEQLKELQREIHPRKGLLGTWDAYGKFTDFLGVPAEASARFSTYSTLRKAGWSIEDAAVYAKEITVNFEQSGNWRAIRNYFMFLNPSVQGTVRMFKDLVIKAPDGSRKLNPKYVGLVGGLVGMGLVMGFVARAIGGQGEDGVDEIDKVARYKRATSVVVAPGVPMGAPLPLMYGWNVFYAVGNFAADTMFGKTPLKQTAGRVLNTAVDAFWPLGQSDSSTALGTAMKTITPTPLSPVLDYIMNESRYGGPIYKGENPFVRAEEASSWRNFASSSPISTAMMRKLNELTGGNQFKGGLIDINPAFVDYMAGAFLPGTASDIGRGVNIAVNASMGKDIKQMPIPLLDRFTAKVSPQWDEGGFRRAIKFVDTKYAEAQATIGNPSREALLKEYPALGAAKGALSNTDQMVRKLNSTLSQIEHNPNYTSAQKVAARNQVERQINAFMRQGVAMAVKAGFRDPVLADR